MRHIFSTGAAPRVLLLLLCATVIGTGACGDDGPAVPTSPTPPFGGAYRLNFIASASCGLPTETIRRTYLARIDETGFGSLLVVLSGAEFVAWGDAGFTGRREGSRVRFDISSDYSNLHQFIELIDPARELAFSGTAAGDASNTVVATFSGQVVVRQRSGTTLARCDAEDHRLEFTR